MGDSTIYKQKTTKGSYERVIRGVMRGVTSGVGARSEMRPRISENCSGEIVLSCIHTYIYIYSKCVYVCVCDLAAPYHKTYQVMSP